jgi:hypothetical protein
LLTQGQQSAKQGLLTEISTFQSLSAATQQLDISSSSACQKSNLSYDGVGIHRSKDDVGIHPHPFPSHKKL